MLSYLCYFIIYHIATTDTSYYDAAMTVAIERRANRGRPIAPTEVEIKDIEDIDSIRQSAKARAEAILQSAEEPGEISPSSRAVVVLQTAEKIVGLPFDARQRYLEENSEVAAQI